jgi:tRNA (guanine37-N1)-methyltransferase
MKISIVTLFPDSFRGFLDSSIIGRAQKSGMVEIETVNLRQFSADARGTVDDKPYGGGVGMILRVDVVKRALNSLKQPGSMAILLTPQGQIFKQIVAIELAKKEHLILICGHYEGFDERIRSLVDMELSIGDYVLTGGELAAAVATDTITRLLPGVLGKDESAEDESFNEDLLEYPQYTKPAEFDGVNVPKILLSGNHAEIAKWRSEQSRERTRQRRPDLFKS